MAFENWNRLVEAEKARQKQQKDQITRKEISRMNGTKKAAYSSVSVRK